MCRFSVSVCSGDVLASPAALVGLSVVVVAAAQRGAEKTDHEPADALGDGSTDTAIAFATSCAGFFCTWRFERKRPTEQGRIRWLRAA
jgi:hypothetical protein